MVKTKNYLFAAGLLLSLAIFGACKKDPGFGGQAAVQGKVYVKDYDKSGFLKSEGYGGDVRVTIAVSGEGAELDDQRTQYDGSYKFPNLRKGNYQVWVYEQCDTCLLDQRVMVQEVVIKDKKQIVTLPDFVIAK